MRKRVIKNLGRERFLDFKKAKRRGKKKERKENEWPAKEVCDEKNLSYLQRNK